ncbi:MAG: NAD(P)H-hydrate dehydratase, partial [Bacteroidales bacterium]|nr:NAD(P)H-hydrate dehydratase [Bacteroidales bacterium]
INDDINEVVSIDLPSGLPCSPGDFCTNGNIVRADLTLTLQQPKLSLLLSDFGNYTKEFEIVDIELKTERIPEKEVNYNWITEKEIKPLIKTRDRFSHKGNYGHALLIAGSYGKMGAAVLAAEACLRTGAGLLSVHAPGSGNQILQTTVPEAMCTPCHQTLHVAGLPVLTPYSAIGAGPGIGTSAETGRCIQRLLQKAKVPLILDADAINLLGQNREWMPLLPARTILTPHPREFERLTEPASSAYERLLKQKAFSEKQGVILVLKGAYTSVSFPDGRIFFNSTGNPGMATAGSGDVLTGIILSLLTIGYEPEQAALLGVFLHGLSGDIAVLNTGQESLMARDLIENIKNATIRLKP